MELYQKLRHMRTTLNMSRPQLSEVLGIAPTSYKNWEMNYRAIPGDLLLRIYNHEDPRINVFGPYLMDAKQEKFVWKNLGQIA